jgi:hypothetical protein
MAGIRLVLGIGCPSFYSLSRGQRKKEDPTKPFPTFPPGLAEIGKEPIRLSFESKLRWTVR